MADDNNIQMQGGNDDGDDRASSPSSSNDGGAAEQQPQPQGQQQQSGEGTAAGSGTNGGGGNQRELVLGWTQLGEESRATALPAAVRDPFDVADLMDDPDETEIVVVGTAGQKITRIGPDFSAKLTNPQLVERLILRSHVIRTMEGLEGFTKLDLLELYDNQVDELKCLGEDNNVGAPGQTLRVLDMSYNSIRDMAPVALCPNLQELYLANNKLKSMAGLKGLSKLRKIDLGANRIRVMDPDELAGLVNLEELWLGKNKIEKIEGLDKLTKLRRLDVQSNRLEKVENLQAQNDTLEELYLAHNGITSDGTGSAETGGLAQSFPKLSVLDLSRNRLTTTAPLAHLTSLEELWLSGNEIATMADVEPLRALGKDLDTIYLEYNPVQASDPLYRKRIAELIPSLTQIDANQVGGPSATAAARGTISPPPSGTGGAGLRAETEEAGMRRLQAEVVDRARAETNSSNNSNA